MKGFNVCTLTALISFGSMASALAGPQTTKEIVGNYTLGGLAKDSPLCTLFLSEDPSQHGWVLYMDEGCVPKFDFTERARAWQLDEDSGAIVFVDQHNTALVEYLPSNETGVYLSTTSSAYPNLALRFFSTASPD